MTFRVRGLNDDEDPTQEPPAIQREPGEPSAAPTTPVEPPVVQQTQPQPDKSYLEEPQPEKKTDVDFTRVPGLLQTADRLTEDLFVGVARGGLRSAIEFVDTVHAGIEALENVTGINIPAGGTEYREWAQRQRELVGDPENLTQSLVEPMAQFLGPFALMQKAGTVVGLANTYTRAYVSGAITDFAFFDPYQEDLFNKIDDLNIPGVSKFVREYLASDEQDEEDVARIKTALRGALMGGAFDMTFRAIRHLKAMNIARRAAQGVDGDKVVASVPPRVKMKDEPELGADIARHKAELDYNQVDSRIAAMRREIQEGEATLAKRVGALFSARKWLDVAHDVHRELRRMGDIGKSAVNRHILIKGTTQQARHVFNSYEDEIFRGLDWEDLQLLENVILNRRIDTIKSYRPDWAAPKRITHEMAQNYLRYLPVAVGEEKAAQMMRLSDRYFDAMREELANLRAHGVISEESFNRMRALDYSPMEFIREIDPVLFRPRGQRVNISESGIKDLEHGSAAAVNMDAHTLLANTVMRSRARIFRNEANKALYEVGRSDLLQDMIKIPLPEQIRFDTRGRPIPDAPKGFVQLHYMDDGVPRAFWMDERMADQWIVGDPQMSHAFASFMRTASGTGVLKASATGYNPAFAWAVDYPRNIFQTIFATNQYSPHLPIAAVQIHADLAAVAGDVFARKGLYRQYIDAGGGLNLLAFQSESLLRADPSFGRDIARELSPSFRKLKDVGTYLNSTEELMFRVAIFRRALKNGLSEADAAAAARMQVDFDQGGSYSKGIDTTVPYFNAAIQSMRAVYTAARERPGDFAIKAGWLGAMGYGLHYANMEVNPEAYRQIPDQDKFRYWNFAIPGMDFVDADGNHRHVYFRLAKPLDMLPFTIPLDHMAIQELEGRTPHDGIVSSIAMGLPNPLNAVPTIAAYNTYKSNYNMWSGATPWAGRTLNWPESRQEYYGQGQGRDPTSQFWVDVGQITGLSPERLKAANAQIVADNPFLGTLRSGYDFAMAGMTEHQKRQAIQEMMAENTWLKRNMRITHPAENMIRDALDLENVQVTDSVVRNRQLDDLYFRRFKDPEIPIRQAEREMDQFIQNLPEEFRQSAMNRYATMRKVDAAFGSFRDLDTTTVPNRQWFVELASFSPETRGEILYWRWRDASPEGRRQMLRIAQAVPGVWGPRANHKFASMIDEYGSARE